MVDERLDTEAGGAAHRAPRRISEEREAEILAAALERLGARGYEALTMDEVAAAAHMSKATLYRLWQGKAGLVSAALQQFTCVAEPADTGSLRGDLIATALRMPAASEERATLLSALVHVARGEPTLRQLLRDRLVRPNEEAISEIFSRAVRRGELSGDSPLLAEIPHLVIYAVLGRVLIDGLVPDEAYALAMIDRIVLPLLDAAGAAHAGATHPPHDRLEP